MIRKAPRKAAPIKEWDISHFSPNDLRPTPENDLLYDGFGKANEDDAALIKSVSTAGVQEPLRVSLDNYIISGHRRLAAAKAAGLRQVPCIVEPVVMDELSELERLRLLRSFNLQREKSFDEKIQEALAVIDPDEAYSDLLSYRTERETIDMVANVAMGKVKNRAEITTMQFLAALEKIIEDNRLYWPLTVRRVHYLMLNNPPLRHDSKPSSTYQNDQKSYKALTNLTLRARLSGAIPMDSIEDETRPVTTWRVFDNTASFVSKQCEQFLQGYSRNLMQGQSNHVEILLEKNALRKVIERVASNYTIPVTTGKGYSSLSPRNAMVSRFDASGRKKLVLLILTDFDPDGEMIASSFPRSLRDDFGLQNVMPIKVLLTAEDVRDNDLPSDLEAKITSPNYQAFVDKYGTHVCELDAAPVELLQSKLKTAIESVIDVEEFNRQVEQERTDQREIAARRKVAIAAIREGCTNE